MLRLFHNFLLQKDGNWKVLGQGTFEEGNRQYCFQGQGRQIKDSFSKPNEQLLERYVDYGGDNICDPKYPETSNLTSEKYIWLREWKMKGSI